MDTPLHLAVEHKDNNNNINIRTGTGKVASATGGGGAADAEQVAEVLARRFTRCIGWRNGSGLDVVRPPSLFLLALPQMLTPP